MAHIYIDDETFTTMERAGVSRHRIEEMKANRNAAVAAGTLEAPSWAVAR